MSCCQSLVREFPRQSCGVGAWLCPQGLQAGLAPPEGCPRCLVPGAPAPDLTLCSSSQPAVTPYPRGPSERSPCLTHQQKQGWGPGVRSQDARPPSRGAYDVTASA